MCYDPPAVPVLQFKKLFPVLLQCFPGPFFVQFGPALAAWLAQYYFFSGSRFILRLRSSGHLKNVLLQSAFVV